MELSIAELKERLDDLIYAIDQKLYFNCWQLIQLKIEAIFLVNIIRRRENVTA